MAKYKHRIYTIYKGVATAEPSLSTFCPTCGEIWVPIPVEWNGQKLGVRTECSCGTSGLDCDVLYSEKKAPGTRFSKKKGIAYE